MPDAEKEDRGRRAEDTGLLGFINKAQTFFWALITALAIGLYQKVDAMTASVAEVQSEVRTLNEVLKVKEQLAQTQLQAVNARLTIIENQLDTIWPRLRTTQADLRRVMDKVKIEAQ